MKSLYVLIAAVLWGVDGVLRRSLYDLAPLTIVFYEHLLGTAVILPFALKAIKKEKFNKNEWISVIGVSLLSGVLGTLWFTKALLTTNFAPFSIVFVLQKLQPLFAIITARMVLKEKITKKFALFATAAIGAAYFVTFKNGVVNWQQDIPLITAATFAIGAAFAWGSSTAFSKYNLQNHSHESITGLRFVLTTAMTFIWIALTNNSLFGPITPAHVGRLTMITFSTGLVALWIYYKGLKHTKAQVATILELAFPATGVLIDLIMYKSSLVWTQYLAMIVLIVAITKLTKAQNA